MSFRGSRRILVAVLLTMGLLFFKSTGFAQQVTYYDFDAPQLSNGSSLTCGDPAKDFTGTNPLFCFNNGDIAAGGTNPGFLLDTYPAIIDPVQTGTAADSSHYAVQLTVPATTQASSMWFSVPQKISNGFTSYFAFKITPAQASYATADGIAFVIQNAAGNIPGAPNSEGNPCAEIGSGPNAVGGDGGCMGYGGLDNSLAVEFDTYKNEWDPTDPNTAFLNSNHIAVQSCGIQPGNTANSPDHGGPCQVQLSVGGTLQPALSGNLPAIMANGNVHQFVVQYSGPNEANPHQLQVFMDPTFVAGTHTPVAGSIPVLSGVYDIGANLALMNSDSAYVGFTSATGLAFEQHELMAWTFTPHTPVTQQQPIAPKGTQTAFPFGAHTYGVTYPLHGPDIDGIDMVVTANTITPSLFSTLLMHTDFEGSLCQIYDETGGNCIVYTTSCVIHTSNVVTQCPPASDDSNLIDLKSAYNNTAPPVSPGFIKGDPFYSQVTTITGDGTTATATCVGECAVTPTESIKIGGNVADDGTLGTFNGPVSVVSATLNTFTFLSSVNGSGSGGYLTSNNLQNAFTSYVSQRIDGTTTGRTKNFSGFAVTSLTTAAAYISITAPSVAYGNTALVTVALTSVGGIPQGDVSLWVDGVPTLTQTLANGSVIFSLSGLAGGNHSLVAKYAAQGIFQAATNSATLTISQAPSSIVITSDTPNPSGVGVAVTVQFKVSGSGVTPTGTYTVAGAAGDPTCNGSLISGMGSCSLTFLTSGIRTITVTYAGDSNYSGSPATVQQNVSGPVAQVSPGSINFGTVYLGTLSLKSVTLTNVGSAPMTISQRFLSIVGGGNSNEFVALSLCPSTLNAGKSCTILVSFIAGPAFNTQTATLMINDNAPGSPQSVGLSANVINPQASFSPSSLNFGTLTVGTPGQLPITLTNSGNTSLNITNTGISGANASDFLPVGNTCPPSLAAKASCVITIRFVPSRTGTRNATLTVNDNVWNGSQQVPLTGKGK